MCSGDFPLRVTASKTYLSPSPYGQRDEFGKFTFKCNKCKQFNFTFDLSGSCKLGIRRLASCYVNSPIHKPPKTRIHTGPAPQILDWGGGGQLVQKRVPWRKGPFFK